MQVDKLGSDPSSTIPAASTHGSFGASIGRKLKPIGNAIYIALCILGLVAAFPIYAMSSCRWERYRDFVWTVNERNWELGVKWRIFEFCVFLTEPGPCLKTGVDGARHFLGESVMNPAAITPEQAQKKPILLIPGSNGQCKYLSSIARKLSQANLGPVFAVDTMDPERSISRRDLRTIDQKIDEIKTLYLLSGVYDVQIDVVGYSRGGYISQYLALDRKAWQVKEDGTPVIYTERDTGKVSPRAAAKNIGKCIQLGLPVSDWLKDHLPEQILEKHFDIDGSQDRVVLERSGLQPTHRYTVECGHAGLMHDDRVAAKLIEILRP